MGDVEVPDPAASVLAPEEAVQHPGRRRRYREEVEGDNRLAVVAKKRKPPFARIAPPLNAPQIPCDSHFRDHKAELLELAVDLRRSPVAVFLYQPPDQDSDLLGDPRPAATRPGSPPPIEAEAKTFP
jgi:hypothetical protein